MKKCLFLVFLFFANQFVQAQSVDTLVQDEDYLYKFKTVLADNNYTIEQIATDTTLVFQPLDSVKPSEMGVFWVKYTVFNPFNYDERLNGLFFPMLDNTLYFFNEQEKRWQSARNGLCVPNNLHNFMNLPCTLKARQNNVLYIKTDVRALSHRPHKVRPMLAFRDMKISQQRKKDTDMVTAITVALVLVFFLFNAYIYFIFRDKTYVYYLLTQIGGIFYVLANSQYLNQLITPRFVQVDLLEDGTIGFSESNAVLTRIAITLILCAFVALTRSYLNTRERLPKWDKILKYIGIAFGTIMATLMAFDAFFWTFSYNSMILDNVMVVLIVLTIFYVTILRYRQKDKAAGYFLLANLVPLVVILFLGVYFLQTRAASFSVVKIANVAVVAQAFCLALALVERFLLIRDELKRKQAEAKELAAQNERIEAELAFHKTELDDYTQSLREKTEAVETLRAELTRHTEGVEQQDWFAQLTQATILTESQWRSFRQKFENVHTDFFSRLQLQIPTVTEAEKRLLALTKLEMSNSEIAAMLGISPESVTKTRYRLRKKVGEEELERLVESL